MAQKIGQQQHIVPKAYLENFINQNGKLFKMRTDLPKKPSISEKHPSAVSYKPDFYKFENRVSIGNTVVIDPNILEKRGFLYEIHIKTLIQKLTSPDQNSLTQEEAVDLSAILFDIKIRNDRIRINSFSRNNLNEVFDSILDDYKNEQGEFQSFLQSEGVTYEKFIEVFERFRIEWQSDKTIQKDIANRILLESKINPSNTKKLILNKLTRGSWTIIKPLIGSQFITSDNPGYCQDEVAEIHNTKFGGSFKFYFPLTPYHALLITSERDVFEKLPEKVIINHTFATSDELKMINQGTYLVANREIYSARETPLLQAWATLYRPFIIT